MRNVFFLLSLSLVAFFFFSCQKEEALYSCDPTIEKWASENSSEINKMSRNQFLEISDYSYKKAAYRMFSSEKKQTIWREKYQELKALNWSEEEWKHIDLIYSLILDNKRSILNTKNIAEDDELLIFMYRWEDYARTTLKWTKKQIYAICFTVDRVTNKQGDLDIKIKQRSMIATREETGGGSGFECSCSQKSSYCDIIDHEGPAYTSCKTPNGGSCKVIEGCGLLWLFDCDGMCLGLYV